MKRPPDRPRLPTRIRILDDLRQRPHGSWTLDELADLEQIDRSVAFEHLEVLVTANLASKRRISAGRGRPVNVYRYAGADEVHPPQRIQLLATLLAKSLAGVGHGAEVAHRVGREFGSTVDGLDRLGGDYSVDDQSVHALSCMFGSSCAAAPEVVCGLHAGLIEGAIGHSGRPMALKPAGPDGLGGCVFAIQRHGSEKPVEA